MDANNTQSPNVSAALISRQSDPVEERRELPKARHLDKMRTPSPIERMEQDLKDENNDELKNYQKQKSIIKTPDNTRTNKPQRKVTFVPPNELATTTSHIGGSISPPARTITKHRSSAEINVERSSSRFKKAIRQGESLKELVDMFYEIE